MRPQPSTTFDLATLQLSHGEGRSIELPVSAGSLEIGGQAYRPTLDPAKARLDVSRTRSGHAMRLRFDLRLEGPCMRCLEPAVLDMAIDAREVDQPDDEELLSPYVSDGELNISRWALDAVALAMPDQVLCRADCAGLCAVCGESLNNADRGEHEHGRGGDPRWAKLRELDLE
jgi:uncharacterized protein